MQNYPYQNYKQNYIQPFNQGCKVIPIANENELNNITVDYTGLPSYFHNQQTNEIFIKQFDMRTGITNIQKFIKADNAQCDLSKVKDNEGINECKKEINALNERINDLKQLIEKNKEEKVNKK